MLNLIKMDFYRLFKTKAWKTGIIVGAIFAFCASLINFGIVELVSFASQENPEAVMGIGMFLAVASWAGGVDFAEIVLTGTGMLSLFVSCMMAASFIGDEQSCGYVKNIAGQFPNRGHLIISKFVTTCFVHLSILVIYTVVCSIFAGIFFNKYITGYSIGAMLAGVLLRFILFCAINAVVLFFCTLTKSHSISMVIGAIFGTGISSLGYKVITMILSIAKISVNMEMITPDGINGLINSTSIGDIALRAIIVSAVFIGLFLSGAIILFKKRDVR